MLWLSRYVVYLRQSPPSTRNLLKRAQNQARTDVKHRFYFDYPSARADINKVRNGINNYINSERAQPRNPKQLKDLSGDYERNRGR